VAGAGGPNDAIEGSMAGLPCRFGKYTLIRKLATGGMAELFLAIQKSVAGFEKLLVIKRILPARTQDRAFIEMLLHEARIAATLSHPNIVQIFDVGAVDGTYFIAMEHVHGEDLRSVVRQMKKRNVVEFPLEHALSIVLGMCAGLAYAHEKRDLDGTALNIVHRDISPQNVVITFTGDVKIVDFGIAQSDAQLQENTTSGKLKGKIPYMSPEQARAEVVDWRSDIFAAGVMLFELTTGKRLFKGPSELETLKLICERDYPLPSQVRLGYPSELENIVMRALAKDRTQRWQSAREMQAALEELVRRERLPVSTIALSQFMQGLFEDKLASQKEALLQGKQLADIIALEQGADSTSSLDLRNSSTSAGAAARTIPNGGAARRRRGRAGLVVGALSAVAAIAIGVGTMSWAKHRHVETPPAAMAADTPTSAPGRGALAIASDPPGASIVVNGESTGQTTPSALAKLALGTPYTITLKKAGFQDAAQTVTLTEQEPSNAVSLALQRGTLSVDVSVKPQVPGVTLALDQKTLSSTTIDGVTAGEPHQLVVWAPGYAAQALSFTGATAEKKHFDVALVKAEASRSSERPAGAAAAAPAAVNAGSGKLNVSAHGGWCNVSIDGAPRGPTPIAGVVLSAGTHTVTCTPEGGKTMTAAVRVEADATARYAFTMPQ
jgi:serine/threonine-protein kinase